MTVVSRIGWMENEAVSDLPTPSFTHETTGLRAFDRACVGLPVGALTQVSGRHAMDVDALHALLRKSDPEFVLLEFEYDVVTKKYRSVVEALRELHGKKKPVIIRCAPPSQGRNFEGEETVQRAVGVVAKMYPRPIVLSWCGSAGENTDDMEMLEIWMASTNIVTLIHARREDEEDDVSGVPHEEMEGELMFDVTFFDPRSKDIEDTSLCLSDLTSGGQ